MMRIGKRDILAITLLLIAGAVVYANTLPHGFVWDDEILVVNNPSIRSLREIPSIFTARLFHGMRGNFYRPLQTLSYALDYSAWGLRPLGFHLSNVVIHLLNAVLVYLILLSATRRRDLSFTAALIFTVHPVNTEAVAYVSGRADLLAALFSYISCLSFLALMRRLDKDRRYGAAGAAFLALSLCAFAAALLTKEAACVLPLLILVCRQFGAGRPAEKAAAAGRIAPYAGLALVLLVYFSARAAAHLSGSEPFSSNPYPFYSRFLTSFKVILGYIRILVFPVGLHMERVVSMENSFTAPGVIVPLALLCGIAAAAVLLSRKSPLIAFGTCWFLAALLPYLNWFPLNAEMAEHWLYIPSVGFYLIFALAAAGLARRLGGDSAPGAPAGYIALVLVPVALCLSVLTIACNRDWRNEEAIFTRTAISSPGSPRAHYNLGNIYREKGRLPDAEREYRESIRLKPWDAASRRNLGKTLLQTGRYREATAEIRAAIGLEPSNSESHDTLGIAYGMQGRNEDSAGAFRKAIALDPANARAHSNLAGVYTNIGLLDEALASCERAIALDPGLIEAQFNLGVIRFHKGEYEQAIAQFDRALAMNPGFRQAAAWRKKAEGMTE